METETLQHTHPRRRRRLGALLLLSLVSGSVGAGALSLAIFTDTDASSNNAFTAGSIDIGPNPAMPAVFTVGTMMPGDTVNGSLTVQNLGTAEFRYAMTSGWVDGPAPSLSAQLNLDVWAGNCAVVPGTFLYSGSAATARFGDPAQHAQAGDRVLGALTNETLCFRATLPLATGNTYMGRTTTGTFTFDAEQTANN
jgi:spore coat-associated protein N